MNMNRSDFHRRHVPALLRSFRHAPTAVWTLALAAIWSPALHAQVQITGTVTVPTDQSSPWDIGNELTVGYLYTSGTLNVQSGSTVSNTSSYVGYAATGTVNVDGPGSTWTNSSFLYAGFYGSSVGNIHLTQGGAASADMAFLGYGSATTQGQISVDGTGSSFTANSLYIGQYGSGAVSITAGGSVSTNATTFAENSGSAGSLTVDGTGSVFNSAGQVTLGMTGTATMTVSDSAHANVSGYTYLGGNSGSDGTLTVSGANAQFLGHDYIWTGYDGTGTLIVKDGGHVAFESSSTQQVIQLGVNSGSTGTLKIGDGGAAGTINAAIAGGSGTGQVIFNHTGAGGGGTYTFASTIEGGINVVHRGPGPTSLTGANTYTGGTTIEGGTLLANNTTGSAFGTGSVTVKAGATLGGDGSIAGLTTVESGATLAPGNSPGTLTFTNGLTLNDGAVLDFQLGTTNDLIRVSGGTLTGSASAGGITLNLSDAGGFAQDTYILFDFTGATTDNFSASDFTLGSKIAGYDYQFVLGATTLSLVATTAVPEPATYALFAGLAGLAVIVARRRIRSL